MLAGLVLIAPLIASSPVSTRSEDPPSPGTQASDAPVEPGTSRSWALLACAVLFERNGHRHDLLAGRERTKEHADDIRATLKKSWDIEKAEHLIEQLEWLEHGGHRADWEKRFRDFGRLSEKEIDAKAARLQDEEDRAAMKALWRNAPKAAKLRGGLLGWDYARYIALCRWGFAAGFLTEAEAWKRMEPIVRDLQKAYTSWEDLGQAYLIGYDCWRPGQGEETQKAFERLSDGESSPWKATPWKLKLAPLDKPEKKR